MSDFAATPAPPVIAWVRKTTGSAGQLAFEPLVGATTSSVYAVTVTGERRYVLRVFTDREWLRREPDLADHEAAALTHAAPTGVPAPNLIGHAGAAECGAPAVLMTYVSGSVDLQPRRRGAWLEALAETLAPIHRTSAGDFPWQYSSWNSNIDAAMPAWFADAALWSAVQVLARRQPKDRHTFLHRDYHPTNVLWHEGQVSGVVDWVNACRGPAGIDVAHCRLNLATMYGNDYAEDFLRAYASAAGGYDHDPHWDVDAAMGWCVPDIFFYPPWRKFGLQPISRAVLRDRLRDFLQNAVER
jgi:aminoglycoside phosphotransferase (APT) family kinase protein